MKQHVSILGILFVAFGVIGLLASVAVLALFGGIAGLVGFGAVGEPVDRLAERQIDSVADRITIDAALAGLPEEFKVAVVMRDVGDLDYAEIATALDLPIGTVKSRIARGRRLLIEQLGNREHPGERPISNPPTTP